MALLFALLLWVPLPFGSTPDDFQLHFVVAALLICALTCVVVALGRPQTSLSAAHRVWAAGGVLFMIVVALQLIVLPGGLLRLLSPESWRIWNGATNVAALLDGPQSSAHPISVDPETTSLHLFRLVAYFAVFTTAALLVRRHPHRVAFAVILGCSTIVQAGFGIRELTTRQFTIWGWKNTLIFDRVTGTFVNPNHYADYAALLAPLGFFVLCTAWRDAAPATARLRYRLIRMFERRVLPTIFGTAVIVASLVSILISKSRGALLALFAGAAIGFAVVTGRRVVRTLCYLAALVVVVASIALYLGREHTSVPRLVPTAAEARTIGGRRTGVETALAIWRRFPLFGSGLGTFIEVSPMVQPDDFGHVYNHAHNDYAELAATTGLLGLIAFLLPLTLGLVRFVRSIRDEASWRRRAFLAAALASISVALTHALVDFPFFIPANALTLAAIAGTAVAMRAEPPAVRGSALEDSQA